MTATFLHQAHKTFGKDLWDYRVVKKKPLTQTLRKRCGPLLMDVQVVMKSFGKLCDLDGWMGRFLSSHQNVGSSSQKRIFQLIMYNLECWRGVGEGGARRNMRNHSECKRLFEYFFALKKLKFCVKVRRFCLINVTFPCKLELIYHVHFSKEDFKTLRQWPKQAGDSVKASRR